MEATTYGAFFFGMLMGGVLGFGIAKLYPKLKEKYGW